MTLPDRRKELVTLLGAVTDELGLMSFEMVEFGEILATDNPFGDKRTYLQKMKSLDLLSEKMALYAKLLSLTAKAMNGDAAGSMDQIKMVIAKANFPKVRDRLASAVEEDSSKRATS